MKQAALRSTWRLLRPLGAACLCLTMLLGCSSLPSGQATPNEALYAHVAEPQPELPLTNDSLSRWTLTLRKTIADMNTDRDSLGAWVSTIKGE